MTDASRYLGNGPSSKYTTIDNNGYKTIRGGAITDLPRGVVSPTRNSAIRDQGTRMTDSSRYLGDTFVC
jgi:hypothetical protein